MKTNELDFNKLNNVLIKKMKNSKLEEAKKKESMLDSVKSILCLYLYRNILILSSYETLINKSDSIKTGDITTVLMLCRVNLEAFYKFYWIINSIDEEPSEIKTKKLCLNDYLLEVLNLMKKKNYLEANDLALSEEEDAELRSKLYQCKKYNDIFKLVDVRDLEKINSTGKVKRFIDKLDVSISKLTENIKFKGKDLKDLKITYFLDYNYLCKYIHPSPKSILSLVETINEKGYSPIINDRDHYLKNSIYGTISMAIDYFNDYDEKFSENEISYLNDIRMKIIKKTDS